jgi:hypothetical protein
MRTILVPIDLGANTSPILDYAVSVAAQNGASLLLLHVIHKQPYDNGTFEPDTAVHRQLRHEAQVILEQLARQTIVRGIRSRVLVNSGVPADVIVRCARENRAEMIVMEPACDEATCTSRQVQQAAPCPILTWNSGSPVSREIRVTTSRHTAPSYAPAVAAA